MWLREQVTMAPQLWDLAVAAVRKRLHKWKQGEGLRRRSFRGGMGLVLRCRWRILGRIGVERTKMVMRTMSGGKLLEVRVGILEVTVMLTRAMRGKTGGWRVLELSVSLPLTVFRLFICFVCLPCTPVFLSPCMKMRESYICWTAR